MLPQATIVVAARNAAGTIRRALSSAVQQGDYPILLVDDYSDDDTVARAFETAGGRLKVVRPPGHETLGATRQAGLLSVETPYGIWLDADDELLPGRADRMVSELERSRVDFVADEAELYDGPAGSFREILRIPGFLKKHHPLVRLFERNYLPGIGVLGFRTNRARNINYDPMLHGAEDVDFVLRAIAGGARFGLLDSVGYRLHAYPESISRQIGNQRRMYRAGLRKHTYDNIWHLYRRAGFDDRIALWGLVSVAMFREDFKQVLDFVARAERSIVERDEVLEPDGPCPYAEGWRVGFFKGTAFLLMGQPGKAVACLQAISAEHPSAAALNNFGVALDRMGDRESAKTQFERSLQLFPGFLDAAQNLTQRRANCITTHPLRVEPARNDYERQA